MADDDIDALSSWRFVQTTPQTCTVDTSEYIEWYHATEYSDVRKGFALHLGVQLPSEHSNFFSEHVIAQCLHAFYFT